MKEIESKAWVFESHKKKVLDFLYTSPHITPLHNGKQIRKKDVMYTHRTENVVAFRLREENDKSWVTKKVREYTDSGTEVNTEIEFEVENGAEFDAFVKMLGYIEMYQKEKKVYQFSYRKNSMNILLEYVEIPVLSEKGDFLEIEIICEDTATEAEILSAETEILSIFTELSLDKDIESLPYGKLLGAF